MYRLFKKLLNIFSVATIVFKIWFSREQTPRTVGSTLQCLIGVELYDFTQWLLNRTRSKIEEHYGTEMKPRWISNSEAIGVLNGNPVKRNPATRLNMQNKMKS